MTFRLAARIEFRPAAIEWLSTLLDHGIADNPQFRYEMITAFGEAFNNIVIHGYEGRSDGMLDVEAELGHDRLTVRLIDTGASVDFSHVPAPDLESMPEGGMGVFMIHALVDEVGYRAGTVNVLSLTKLIPSEAKSRR